MLVQLPLRWRFTLIDASGDSSLMRGAVKSGISVTDALDGLSPLRDAISALSEGVIVGQSVSITQSQQPRVFAPTSEPANRIGAIQFDTTSPIEFFSARIPGFDPSHTVSTGPLAGIAIDLTDPLVSALISELLSGLWCNPWGFVLSSALSGYIREES